MSREIKDLFATDWCEELESSDKATRREGSEEMEVVLLAGLQRLSRLAGIEYQSCVIQTPGPSMVQAVYSARFLLPGEDGGTATFVGTADCNSKNTSGRFATYPTAVAESRAEARCLRKALGIRMLSSEEIGFREGAGTMEAKPGGQAAGSVIKAIETLCEGRGVDVVQVLEEVLDADRAAVIFELSELTTDEAQKAMGWLNNQKPVSKRSARKKELEAKAGK